MPPIVAILGQSNAAGRGPVPMIPNYVEHGYNVAFPAVQIVRAVGDSPQDPLVWVDEYGPDDLKPIPSGNGIFGVELSMCRRLYRAGYEHAVAQYAIGSTSLGVHWLPTGAFPTGDNLFTRAVAFLVAAETQLDGEIAEIIWIQGEADAGNATHAANYASNLRALIEAFRVTFPGIPCTINRLHSGAGGAHNATVRAAQDLVARTVPGVRIFTSDDLPLDGAHYTAIGFMALGERFADAILNGRDDTGPSTVLRSGVMSGLTFDTGANFPPVASFTYVDTGLSVAFTDTSEDLEASPAAWSWDFGDGETSTTQDPTHVYAAEGTYAVTLTAFDSRGRAGRLTTSIEITESLWAIDATSGKAVPADSTEWDALVAAETLAVGSPEHLWLFQDASGNLAAAVGGKALTMTGTPLYEQSETGWARKFIRASGAAANQFASAGSMAATTEAVAVLILARTEQPASGHQRAFYGGASSNAFEGPAGAATMRYRTGSSARNGSTSHAGTVRWCWLVHDPSGTGRMGLYSRLEKLTFDAGTTPAYAARSGTNIQFQFGIAADTTAITSIGYAAAWSGSGVEFADLTAMDAAATALLTALGEPPVW